MFVVFKINYSPAIGLLWIRITIYVTAAAVTLLKSLRFRVKNPKAVNSGSIFLICLQNSWSSLKLSAPKGRRNISLSARAGVRDISSRAMWQKAVMTTSFVTQRAAKQKCVTNRTQLPSSSQFVICGLDLPIIPTYMDVTSGMKDCNISRRIWIQNSEFISHVSLYTVLCVRGKVWICAWSYMKALPLVLLQTVLLDRVPRVMRDPLPNVLHRSIGLNIC